MEVIAKKNFVWSINHKPQSFEEDKEYQIPDNLAVIMKESGYVVGKKGRPSQKKEDLVKENKAIEPSENKKAKKKQVKKK